MITRSSPSISSSRPRETPATKARLALFLNSPIMRSRQEQRVSLSASLTIREFLRTSEPLNLSVLDNGCGMDPTTLRQALRFGGSSRFNDRSGLGRFGIGLPNSSLSTHSCIQFSTRQKCHLSRQILTRCFCLTRLKTRSR
jgi:hypothetical protein